jgi:hypothetical protein
VLGGLATSLVVLSACSDPERDRVKATTQASYDQATGKLSEITFDKNKNGKIDTWTKMDGARALSSRIDTDEDGKIDRWEEYGPDGTLVKAMWERPKPPTAADRTMTGKPDATAYMDADGLVERIEYSEVSDVTKIEGVVRREFYRGTRLLHADEDTDGDGLMDRFEHFNAQGALESVEFDEVRPFDGKPDRRLTYGPTGVIAVETHPDGKGGYLRKTTPGKN